MRTLHAWGERVHEQRQRPLRSTYKVYLGRAGPQFAAFSESVTVERAESDQAPLGTHSCARLLLVTVTERSPR